MDGSGWISLFRRIPSEFHNALVLMTTNGRELVIQRVIRLEHDFLAAVGRLGGSTDQGTFMLIPYDQLTYLSLSKKLDENEMVAILGGAAFAPAAPEFRPSVTAPPPVAAPAPVESTAPPKVMPSSTDRAAMAASANSSIGKNGMPSKSILLARLRERLAEDSARQVRP